MTNNKKQGGISEDTESITPLQYLFNVLERSSEGMLIADKAGKIRWANSALEAILEKPKKDICSTGLKIYFENDDNEDCFNIIMNDAIKDGEWEGNVRIISKQGHLKFAFLRMFINIGAGGGIDYITGIFKDITEEKKKERTIYELEYIDTLTKLYNKEYLIKTIDRETEVIKKDEKIAVICLDLNCFKTINDLQGRYVGDEILRYFTNQLKICTGNENIVARVGGDEFAVLIPQMNDISDAYNITNQLISNLNIPVTINKQEIFITFAAGICVYPDDTTNPEEILHYADIAMYNAKSEKNKYVVRFTNAMKDSLDDLFSMTNHLRSAIEKKELYLNYQPIFDIETGKMVSAEVLLRWNSEALGSIPPDRFIPIAEQSGQIIEIGDWVMREACRQSVIWSKAGYEKLPLAVNVSIKQLEAPDFPEKLKAIIEETGIETKYLEIEITESILPENYDEVTKVIEAIKSFGIKISIDDFGTGYSSLARLKEMAINKLKIDRAFINSLDENDSNDLVSSIISLGKSLNLKLVAEGIETEKQLNYLKHHNCQLGQGFLFSKPVDKDVFEDRLLVHY